MSERFGPALQEANIRALTPHDEFDHRFDNLMPPSAAGLRFNSVQQHLPDADEPANGTGEEKQHSVDLITSDDPRSFVSFFGGADESDSEIDEIMHRDLDPDWPDRPLDDLDFDPYPDSSGQPLDSAPAPKPASAPASVQAPDPAFDAAPVAYVGGIRGRGTMADKYGSFAETQCIPFCTDRRFTDSHGDRGRKRHRPMHVSIRHMMPIDES